MAPNPLGRTASLMTMHYSSILNLHLTKESSSIEIDHPQKPKNITNSEETVTLNSEIRWTLGRASLEFKSVT